MRLSHLDTNTLLIIAIGVVVIHSFAFAQKDFKIRQKKRVRRPAFEHF